MAPSFLSPRGKDSRTWLNGVIQRSVGRGPCLGITTKSWAKLEFPKDLPFWPPMGSFWSRLCGEKSLLTTKCGFNEEKWQCPLAVSAKLHPDRHGKFAIEAGKRRFELATWDAWMLLVFGTLFRRKFRKAVQTGVVFWCSHLCLYIFPPHLFRIFHVYPRGRRNWECAPQSSPQHSVSVGVMEVVEGQAGPRVRRGCPRERFEAIECYPRWLCRLLKMPSCTIRCVAGSRGA